MLKGVMQELGNKDKQFGSVSCGVTPRGRMFVAWCQNRVPNTDRDYVLSESLVRISSRRGLSV